MEQALMTTLATLQIRLFGIFGGWRASGGRRDLWSCHSVAAHARDQRQDGERRPDQHILKLPLERPEALIGVVVSIAGSLR
jgi:hypothetical protein